LTTPSAVRMMPASTFDGDHENGQNVRPSGGVMSSSDFGPAGAPRLSVVCTAPMPTPAGGRRVPSGHQRGEVAAVSEVIRSRPLPSGWIVQTSYAPLRSE